MAAYFEQGKYRIRITAQAITENKNGNPEVQLTFDIIGQYRDNKPVMISAEYPRNRSYLVLPNKADGSRRTNEPGWVPRLFVTERSASNRRQQCRPYCSGLPATCLFYSDLALSTRLSVRSTPGCNFIPRPGRARSERSGRSSVPAADQTASPPRSRSRRRAFGLSTPSSARCSRPRPASLGRSRDE